jgi:hypothetical protein
VLTSVLDEDWSGYVNWTFSQVQAREPAGMCVVDLFSYVAYVWLRGAKTTGPIAKKFVFS